MVVENYHFDTIIENGIQFEYWDVSNIYFSEISIVDKIEKDYVRKFRSYKQFEVEIKKQNNSETGYFFEIGINRKSLKLYKILCKYNCVKIKQVIAVFPTYQKTKIEKLKSFFTFNLISKMLNRFLPYVYFKLRLINPFDFVFAAGSIAIDLNKNVSKVINFNSYDYDNYLISKLNSNHKRIIPENYCVFIDNYITNHPDLKILNLSSIEPQKYFETLNRFFEIVETKFNIKVVIAAHPKADYSKTNPFNNRPIYKQLSNELIKDCEFVLGHFSTTFSFAVLYKKPVILFYTNELITINNHRFFDTITNLSNVLKCNILNADSCDADDIMLKEVDKNTYTDYKYKYLTSLQSENRFSKDILIDFIKNTK